jgi:hypothetical protein
MSERVKQPLVRGGVEAACEQPPLGVVAGDRARLDRFANARH